MSEPIELFENSKPKSQKGLWLVVGGLAILLIAINLWPDEKDAKPRVVVPSPAVAAKPSQEPAKRKIDWPTYELSEVIRANPFEPDRGQLASSIAEAGSVGSESPAAQATAALGSRVAAPVPQLNAGKYPVKMVFYSSRGSAALIGDEIVHEGDIIEDMKIVKISDLGVTLQPLPKSKRP